MNPLVQELITNGDSTSRVCTLFIMFWSASIFEILKIWFDVCPTVWWKISLIPWQNMKSMNCQKQTARPFIINVIMLLPLVLLVLSIAFFDNKFQCVLIKHLIGITST